MADNMKPPVAKSRLLPELRARVLELRRTQSAKATAQALGIPLGTVKAISSRAGITRDNTTLRAFFRLPEIVASDCTALQPPVATFYCPAVNCSVKCQPKHQVALSRTPWEQS